MLSFFFILSILGLQTAAAAPACLTLFTETKVLSLYTKDGKVPSGYSGFLQSLMQAKPGTKFSFLPNEQFTFKKFLGNGQTTVIVETMEGHTLRIPQEDPMSGSLKNPALYKDFIESYLNSSQELAAAGVRVAEVDLSASRPPRFLVVQKEDIYFKTTSGKTIALTLEKFLTEAVRKELNFTEADTKAIYDKLIEFAVSTWKFSFIGDFNETQLAYNGREWVLIDFARRNTKAVSVNQRQNTFSPQRYEDHIHEVVPSKLYERIEKAIIEKRKQEYANQQRFSDPQMWFQRRTVLPKSGEDYILASEVGLGQLFGRKVSLSRNLLSKSSAKKLPVKDGLSQHYVDFKIIKLVKNNEDSALFTVQFYHGQKGFLEVSLSVLGKKDEYTAGKLLKKKGYSKSDIAILGPDYALVID